MDNNGLFGLKIDYSHGVVQKKERETEQGKSQWAVT